MNKISDIKFEILGELLKNPIHVRELENRLNIPKSTISDKLKELYEENIVDFNLIGRNKEFFIKNSFESSQILRILENYKLIKLIQIYPTLKPIIEEIQKLSQNNIILIFGSFAKNLAHKNSDIDIFIQTNSSKLKEEVELINSKISVKIGDLKKENNLIKEIKQDYIIVCGIDDFMRIKNE